MADTTTTKHAFVKPEVGASDDTWGAKLNADLDSIDSILNVASSTAEVLAGVATNRSVTPDALAALWEQGVAVASAATITLGDGGYFSITGNVTITDIDFTTDKAGRTAWLTFTGAPLLTHSATLILPGATNIQIAAGDKIQIVSEGSDVVRCVSYTPNVNVKSILGGVKLRVFAASATYTPSAGLVAALIFAIGAGGGAGGCPASVAGAQTGAGGGGGGALSIALKTAAQIGASQVVTVGAGGNGGASPSNGTAGGDTSVGSLVLAKGGNAGTGGSGGAGGAGGAVASGVGDLVFNGNAGMGGQGSSTVTSRIVVGFGGASPFGGSGVVMGQTFNATGQNGLSYGAGGGAGASHNGGAAQTGGNGADGVVFIVEFTNIP